MTPQLITYDFGHHNRDLLGSSSRIIEGGTWKDCSTIMILPASKMVPSKVALSWMNLIPAPNNKFYRMMTVDVEIGEAYSFAISQILAHPDLSTWKYILTVEHDNIPPPTGLLDLYKSMEANPDLSCIGGLYWTKGEGGIPQIWGDIKDPILNFRPQPPVLGQLVECYGTGMGFNLWRMDLFKDTRIQRPWFQTMADHRGCATQDLAFWTEAKKYGKRCGIDCSILVGHLDHASDIIW